MEEIRSQLGVLAFVYDTNYDADASILCELLTSLVERAYLSFGAIMRWRGGVMKYENCEFLKIDV